MHCKRLKRLKIGAGEVGPTLLCDQRTSTVQTNGDLKCCCTDVDTPQTVSLQNDVTIGLKINCVSATVVTPTPTWTFGSASPAITICWKEKLKCIQQATTISQEWFSFDLVNCAFIRVLLSLPIVQHVGLFLWSIFVCLPIWRGMYRSMEQNWWNWSTTSIEPFTWLSCSRSLHQNKLLHVRLRLLNQSKFFFPLVSCLRSVCMWSFQGQMKIAPILAAVGTNNM